MHSVVYLAFALVASAAASPLELQARAFGPLGGMAPAVVSNHQSGSQASQRSGSQMSATPFGTSASQFSDSHASSYSHSSTQVVGAFSNVAAQLAQMQRLLAGGSLSFQVAQQQMMQLASSFQSAFSQFPQCAGCLTPNGGPLLPVLSNMFNQFASVMSSYQSTFGSQFGSLASPLAGMSNQFSSFFRSVSQSGTSFRSFLPNNFGPIFANVVPGAAPVLNRLFK